MGKGGGGGLRTSIFMPQSLPNRTAQSFMFNRTAHPHFKISLLGHIAHLPCSLAGICISITSSTGRIAPPLRLRGEALFLKSKQRAE